MKRKLLYTALALSVFAPPGMAETIATASGRLVPVKAWKATHSGPVVPAEIEATCKEIIARVNSLRGK